MLLSKLLEYSDLFPQLIWWAFRNSQRPCLATSGQQCPFKGRTCFQRSSLQTYCTFENLPL